MPEREMGNGEVLAEDTRLVVERSRARALDAAPKRRERRSVGRQLRQPLERIAGDVREAKRTQRLAKDSNSAVVQAALKRVRVACIDACVPRLEERALPGTRAHDTGFGGTRGDATGGDDGTDEADQRECGDEMAAMKHETREAKSCSRDHPQTEQARRVVRAPASCVIISFRDGRKKRLGACVPRPPFVRASYGVVGPILPSAIDNSFAGS